MWIRALVFLFISAALAPSGAMGQTQIPPTGETITYSFSDVVAQTENQEPETRPGRVIYEDGTPAAHCTFSFPGQGGDQSEVTTDAAGRLEVPIQQRRFGSGNLLSMQEREPRLSLVDGEVVYRLPNSLVTLEGRALSGFRLRRPMVNTDLVFRATYAQASIQGRTLEDGWQALTLIIPAREIEERVTTDSDGLFHIEEFTLAKNHILESIQLDHAEPFAWEPDEQISHYGRGGTGQGQMMLASMDLTNGPIDFYLAEPMTFTGTVVHGETGAPMAGLEVSVTPYRKQPVHTVTNEAGQFTFERLPAILNPPAMGQGEFILPLQLSNTPHCWVETNSSVLYHRVRDANGFTATFTVAERDMISLRAIDPAGNPVPRVLLTAHQVAEDGEVIESVALGNTDEEGRLHTAKPQLDGTLVISGRGERLSLLFSEHMEGWGSGEIPVLELPTANVVFEVVDHEMNPLHGVSVQFQTRSPQGARISPIGISSATDEQGLTRMRARPLTPTEITLSDNHGIRLSTVIDLRTQNLDEPITLVVDEPEQTTIRGMVISTAGQALEGALVMSEWTRDYRLTTTTLGERTFQSNSEFINPVRFARTDSEGRFELEAEVGMESQSLQLMVEKEGYIRTEYQHSVDSESTIHLSPSVIITGQITSPLPSNGLRSLNVTAGHMYGNGSLRSDGQFMVELRERTQLDPGRLDDDAIDLTQPICHSAVIRITEDRYAEIPVEVTREPGQVHDLGDVELTDSLDFRVRVIDPDGNPLEGAIVHIVPEGSRAFTPPIETGPDGLTIALPVARVSTRVIVRKDEHHTSYEIIDIADSSVHTVTLQPWEKRTVGLTVLNTDGSPSVGTEVRMDGRIGFEMRTWDQINEQQSTDENGHVLFTDVPHGDYSLRLNPVNGDRSTWYNCRVTVGDEEGQVLDPEYTLPLPEWIDITLHFVETPPGEDPRGHLSTEFQGSDGSAWRAGTSLRDLTSGARSTQTVRGTSTVWVRAGDQPLHSAPFEVTEPGQSHRIELESD